MSLGLFESWLLLFFIWWGLRDDEFLREIGIDGGVFVYMSGFIGGNKIFEGVFVMVEKVLVMRDF